MKRLMPFLLSIVITLLANNFLFVPQGYAQEKEEPISEEIKAHVFKPNQVDATEERINQLELPEGFTISKFAEGLENPRMIAVGSEGSVYVTQRKPGNVLLIKDSNEDGQADEINTIIEKEGAHGLTIRDNMLYLVTVNEVYSAELSEDGTTGKLTLLIDDLPDGGQHPNRTIAFGPDDMMYISVGSTCNACGETNEENATLLRANPDGSDRTIFAKGLRNTIGFDWHPQTGNLYGMDHGTDWLGDDEQKEELNQINEGADYGWPVVHGDGKFNKSQDPDSLTYEEYAAQSEEPVLLHTAHSAPMQFLFYESDMFPKEYQNDGFVTFRGSWNRKPASGYKISRVHFEDGNPAEFEDFVTGFLTDDGQSHFARLAGLAVYTDGSLLVTDDTNGVIYRISYEGE